MASISQDIPDGYKRCSKCGAVKPMTTEYFHRNKNKLRPDCKICHTKDTLEWNRCHPERFNVNKKKWREQHKKENKITNHLWYLANRIEILEREYQKRLSKPPKPPKTIELSKRERKKIAKRKRRTKKALLPYQFTIEDEHRALDYFHGCCAVCGRPLRDLFGEHYPAMDHWIPISDPRPDNPGTVPWNMVPLCQGVGGCNNKKHNRDPLEWLESEYGKKRAREIEIRIRGFFDFVLLGY